ncbi:hypothetical protein [Nereida ignava]|uniref:hypothetical protein n=1 Tax=Nereida ignava TaxID=282199 RepID=UPI0030F72D07
MQSANNGAPLRPANAPYTDHAQTHTVVEIGDAAHTGHVDHTAVEIGDAATPSGNVATAWAVLRGAATKAATARAVLHGAATKAAIARAETLEDLVADAVRLNARLVSNGLTYQGLHLARQWAIDHPAQCIAKATGISLVPGATACADTLFSTWHKARAKSIYELLCVTKAAGAAQLQEQLGAQLGLKLFDDLFRSATAGHALTQKNVPRFCATMKAMAPAAFRRLVQKATRTTSEIAAGADGPCPGEIEAV